MGCEPSRFNKPLFTRKDVENSPDYPLPRASLKQVVVLSSRLQDIAMQSDPDGLSSSDRQGRNPVDVI